MKNNYAIFVIALMVLSMAPVVLADGTDVGGGIIIGVNSTNNVPVVYTDATQRSWYPNDQTFKTANVYGTAGVNVYGDDFYDLGIRGDYVFAGETVTNYVIVEDKDGASDIDSVILTKDNIGMGSCSEIAEANLIAGGAVDLNVVALGYADWAAYALAKFGVTWDTDTMNVYRCKMVVQNAWTGVPEINVKATDRAGATAIGRTDRLTMNPALKIDLNGQINFGSANAGDTVTSNTVYLENVGTEGVVMDMYIASDDYFTDPNNAAAICGLANGIPFDAFSYYATKGSVDSGSNDNAFPGLSTQVAPICAANADEYTTLTSHSEHVEDMCRIINHRSTASFLTQGQSMSMTFRLTVPTPCKGSFSDGEFHMVGRVV